MMSTLIVPNSKARTCVWIKAPATSAAIAVPANRGTEILLTVIQLLQSTAPTASTFFFAITLSVNVLHVVANFSVLCMPLQFSTTSVVSSTHL